MRCRHDHGQSAVLLLIVVAALGVAMVGALADFGGLAQERSRAQSAADSAALASLDGGAGSAADFAARHGAILISWSRGPGAGEVTVVVRVGDTTATARASNAP